MSMITLVGGPHEGKVIVARRGFDDGRLLGYMPGVRLCYYVLEDGNEWVPGNEVEMLPIGRTVSTYYLDREFARGAGAEDQTLEQEMTAHYRPDIVQT